MWRHRIVASGLILITCAVACGIYLQANRVLGQQGPTGDLYGPLPPPVQPPSSVPLSAVEQLGKDLLFDHTLSDPPGYACATCHVQETGFTGPSSLVNAFAGPQPGVRVGRFGDRKPQSYAYAAFSPIGPYFEPTTQTYVGGDFWDGRVPDLAGQARQPPVDPEEMDNIPTNGIYPPHAGGYSVLVVQKVSKRPYAALFTKAYGMDVFKEFSVPEIYTLITEAIAAYESTGEVCPFSSKYDASIYGVPPQNKYKLSAWEERGLMLYFGKAMCSQCHSSQGLASLQFATDGKDTFTMYCFANIGVPKNPNNPFYQQTDCQSDPHGCNPEGTKYVDTGLASNPNPAFDGTVFLNKPWAPRGSSRSRPHVTSTSDRTLVS